MSSNELTSHSHYFQSVSRFWNLCSASAIQPHFIQSHLICYLSLCTSATQLMCEPCNVLQSGPRFDFIQPFFSFWNLCSASAIQLPWTYATPLPSSPFLSFAVSQNYLNSISFHGTNRQTLLNDFVRHAQIQNINSNCKSQVPDSLFCFSL